jgi:hypothetical protein
MVERIGLNIVDKRDGRKQIDLMTSWKDVIGAAESAGKLERFKDVNEMTTEKPDEMEFLDMVDVKIRKDVVNRIVEIEGEDVDMSDAIENIVDRVECLEQDLDTEAASVSELKEGMAKIMNVLNEYDF